MLYKLKNSEYRLVSVAKWHYCNTSFTAFVTKFHAQMDAQIFLSLNSLHKSNILEQHNFLPQSTIISPPHICRKEKSIPERFSDKISKCETNDEWKNQPLTRMCTNLGTSPRSLTYYLHITHTHFLLLAGRILNWRLLQPDERCCGTKLLLPMIHGQYLF